MFTWPHLVFRELLLFLLVVAVVLFLAVFWNAPLEEIANPVHPPNPAKAPWYFLGLQELVTYSAFWGGVVVPGLLVTALVAALPRPQAQGCGPLVCARAQSGQHDFHHLSRDRRCPDGDRHPVPRPELVLARAVEETARGDGGPLTW